MTPPGLAARLAADGLDLAVAGPLAPYQAAVPAEYRLPDFGRAAAEVVLVGNTRALWPRFTACWRADPALRACAHPLDTWVEARVRAALDGLAWGSEVRFAHEAPPRRPAIQRLAQVLGLGHLGPPHLVVHPVHGPWIALRAAIVLDRDWEGPPPPPAPDPCTPCAKPCLAPLARAQEPGAGWEHWLAVRDACPVGRAHRYPEPQVRYHYTKDRRWLEADAKSPPTP